MIFSNLEYQIGEFVKTNVFGDNLWLTAVVSGIYDSAWNLVIMDNEEYDVPPVALKIPGDHIRPMDIRGINTRIFFHAITEQNFVFFCQ